MNLSNSVTVPTVSGSTGYFESLSAPSYTGSSMNLSNSVTVPSIISSGATGFTGSNMYLGGVLTGATGIFNSLSANKITSSTITDLSSSIYTNISSINNTITDLSTSLLTLSNITYLGDGSFNLPTKSPYGYTSIVPASIRSVTFFDGMIGGSYNIYINSTIDASFNNRTNIYFPPNTILKTGKNLMNVVYVKDGSNNMYLTQITNF